MKLALERYNRSHGRSKPDRHPDARSLSEHFEFILPLHLLCYMERQHIIAFCALRNKLRDFALLHEGTVPDLRTERSGVVESGLSPAKRNVALDRDLATLYGVETRTLNQDAFTQHGAIMLTMADRVIFE